MSDTKEMILKTALKLFAKGGYEAVSVSDIAGELGMTKGALYKHYKNKRDIFDCIVERMYAFDAENSRKNGVPTEEFAENPQNFSEISIESVKNFTVSQFMFWTKDEFASDFRRMLTIEQFRNTEIAQLYGKTIAEGVVEYLEDIFREMMTQGVLKKGDPKLLAVEYYSPFFLLVSISDRNCEIVVDLLKKQIDGFFEKNSITKEN